MKVLYDHQAFTQQDYGGISRYIFALVQQAHTAQPPTCDLTLLHSNNAYLRNSNLPLNIQPSQHTDGWCGGLAFKGKGILHRALTHCHLAKHPETRNRAHAIHKLKAGEFDLFHPTYYGLYFIKYLRHRPFVLTVYDMIQERFAGIYFKPNDPILHAKRLLIQRAHHLFAISNHTKQDIIQLLGIDEQRITVTPLANSLNPDVAATDPLPDAYILFIGDRHLYKNFIPFLQAIAPLLAEDRTLTLVCGGSKPFSPREQNIIHQLNLTHRVIHQAVRHDHTLVQLYRNARCFVFPSLYEGFGIPVLEAYACQCPVALSKTSSLPEVGGDAALYFDPQNPEEIYHAVKRIVHDPALADELRRRSQTQLAQFSWDRCTQITQQVYAQVLQQHQS